MGEGSEGVRVAVVTGVSRRTGIGFAIAQRLLAEGRNVLIHSWSAHDTENAGTDDGEMTRVIEELGGLGPRLAHIEADFVDPDEPGRVIDHAIAQFGAVDVVIANHARSAAGSLGDLSSVDLDLAWAVNARASVLLVQAYAKHHDDTAGTRSRASVHLRPASAADA